MSTRNFCDYPDCKREATTRIIEEPYLPSELMDGFGSGSVPSLGHALDACDEHRTVTHPGWWCMDHEEALRQQAARAGK